MSLVRIAFVSCFAAVLAASSLAEAADEKCADVYRNAQVQRKNGALRRARESLLVCVSDRCPAVLQPDCTRWLTEVEAALPSIAFAAKGADGHDVAAVRVVVDGQVVTETLDGKSLPIDPGSHALRFETAGEPPIEQTVVIREGEKARPVSVSWAKAPPPDAPGLAPAKRSGPPTAAWVFGGVGLASLATFGVLSIHGMSRRSDLRDECFGRCEASQVDSVKTELVIGDVALGVGIAAIAVSTVLFFTGGGTSSRAYAGFPQGLRF